MAIDTECFVWCPQGLTENYKQLESLLLQCVEVSQNEKVNGKGLSLLGLPVTFESFHEHSALRCVSLVQNFPADWHTFRQALGVCVSNYCLLLETQTGEHDSCVKLYDCNSIIQDPGAVGVHVQPNGLLSDSLSQAKLNKTYVCKTQILMKVLKISYWTWVCIIIKEIEKRESKNC